MATAEAEVVEANRPQSERRRKKRSELPLHRISTVRQQQGVTLRAAAKQLGCDVDAVKSQEEETSDLRLSDLLEWQRVLEVPLADLLVDHDAPLSRPVMERARLVRIMKTAAAIRERAKTTGTRRLASMLVDQLTEMMPELAEIGPWHSVGQRRSLDEFGRVVERRLAEDILYRHRED